MRALGVWSLPGASLSVRGLSLLACVSGILAATEFPAGKESELTHRDLEYPVVVYVPPNYETSRSWPVVFHYHGTNGRPNVVTPRHYTRERDFVLVGMDYRIRGAAKANLEFYEHEVRIFREVLATLDESLQLDRNRIYLGGFSKGGWFAGTMGESFLKDELAGIYVLGAGSFHHKARPPESSPRSRSCYLGVGQLELNFPYAVRAIEQYRDLGFSVTFDSFPGLGHQVPLGRNPDDPFHRSSRAFFQWWDVERYRPSPRRLQQDVLSWFERMRRWSQNSNYPASDRYLSLYRAQRLPYAKWLTRSQKDELSQWLASLVQDPEVEAERTTQRAYFRLVTQEIDAKAYEPLLEVCRSYHTVLATYPETYHGVLAGLSAARLSRQLRDLGRWRLSSPEQRARLEALLLENPLPAPDQEELLGRLRDRESDLVQISDP